MLARALVAQKLLDGSRNQAEIFPQSFEVFGMVQQRQQSVADQVRRRLQSTYHRDDQVCYDLVLGEAVAIDFGGRKARYETFAGFLCLSAHSLMEVAGHLLEATEDVRRSSRIVLEVAKHLGEIL